MPNAAEPSSVRVAEAFDQVSTSSPTVGSGSSRVAIVTSVSVYSSPTVVMSTNSRPTTSRWSSPSVAEVTTIRGFVKVMSSA